MTGTITAANLMRIGFTMEQVERLEALRAAYPYIEFVDSAEEWRRLVFLKWLYARHDTSPEERASLAAHMSG
jgi:hypothetical protein